MKNNIVKPILVMFIITALITCLLAYTNSITKEPIAKAEAEALNRLLREVVPEAETFAEVSELEVNGSTLELLKARFFEAKAGEDCIGYTVNIVEKGYGGDIQVVVGILPDRTIKNVKVGSHSETPGVGEVATKGAFLEQFNVKPQDKFTVANDGLPGSIEAVSGATISSKAVTKAVSTALDIFDAFTTGGN